MENLWVKTRNNKRWRPHWCWVLMKNIAHPQAPNSLPTTNCASSPVCLRTFFWSPKIGNTPRYLRRFKASFSPGLPHVYRQSHITFPVVSRSNFHGSRLFGSDKAPIQHTAQRCLVAVRSCSRITQLGNNGEEWWAVVASGDVWSNTTPDLLYIGSLRTSIPPASSLPSFGSPWLSKSKLPSEFNLDGWRWVIFEATDQSCYIPTLFLASTHQHTWFPSAICPFMVKYPTGVGATIPRC